MAAGRRPWRCGAERPGGPPQRICHSASSNATVYAGPNDTVTGGAHVTIELGQLAPSGDFAVVADTGTPITDTVVGFVDGLDFLTFPGETLASAEHVAATAKVVSGNITLNYPNHFTVTLVGWTHVAGSFFGYGQVLAIT